MKYIELIYCKLVWFITKTDLDWFSSKLKFENGLMGITAIVLDDILLYLL